MEIQVHLMRTYVVHGPNISYEHIKYGRKTLYQHLCNLFNLVLRTLYTPSDRKRSVLIPLFKG